MRATAKAILCSATALCALALAPAAASAAEEFDKYALESVSASLSSNQAGAHADLTTSFELTENEAEARPYGLTKDVFVALPPGMIGNPQGFPRCTLAQFGQKPEESQCPQDAQVGVSEITLAGEINGTLIEPIYNMVPPAGTDIVARLGLFAGPYPSLINVRVNPVDYSLTAAVEGAPGAAELIAAETTLWAVPASEDNDALRLTPTEALNSELPPGGRASGQPEIPFLTNPTDCSLQRQITVTAISYQLPAKPSTMSAPFPQLGGCGKLGFGLSFSATPTNPEAAAPTGLDAVLEIPQDETPNGTAPSTLKSARVSLPAGMTINPAAGDGLAACSAAQVGFATASPSACPDAAKIGSAEIEVPALERTLNGSVYQRTPEPGNLFRFWLVTDEQGVHLKLPAEIQADPVTGQLSTVFAGIPALGGNPQVPFSKLSLHIFGGPRAPLATPAACGTYQTSYEFTPWSGRPPATGQAPMAITTGCGKGGFSPALSAGTVDATAGAFSAFTMTLTRADGQANPQKIDLALPEGLLAKLAGVALCPEAAAPAAACPEGSRLGSVAVASGVGGAPLWIPQPGKAPTAVYLAGPYKGAPYSILVRVPAQAGPFDLGTVVTRAAIHIDPETALASVATDPLPQILEGVPIAYRAVNVLIDRPGFILNPTDCSAKQIAATVLATNGATATPTSGYQATNCAKLGFKPKLSLSLKGGTRRTANTALRAVLQSRKGDANLKGAVVVLPPSQFIDNAHINNPCTRAQFSAGACPKSSILGRARAFTPLLDQPLEGPVYFRSNGGERDLPDVVAALKGPIEFNLTIAILSSKKTGRVTTKVLNAPDAPVTKFVLRMAGGKKGLLENSENLCRSKQRATLNLSAQNGRVAKTRPLVKTSCKGKGKKSKRAARHRRG